jgi:hypothetical protein
VGIAALRRHYVAATDACMISIAVVIAGLDPAMDARVKPAHDE